MAEGIVGGGGGTRTTAEAVFFLAGAFAAVLAGAFTSGFAGAFTLDFSAGFVSNFVLALVLAWAGAAEASLPFKNEDIKTMSKALLNCLGRET